MKYFKSEDLEEGNIHSRSASGLVYRKGEHMINSCYSVCCHSQERNEFDGDKNKKVIR